MIPLLAPRGCRRPPSSGVEIGNRFRRLPGERREAGWGGDGVETEIPAGQLQSEVFSLQRTQVSTRRFVNDLAGTFFRNPFANHHQPQKALTGSYLGSTAVAIEKQQTVKLVLKFIFGTRHGAHDQ